jgi:mono/diheme cytochrome c family protein
MLPENAGVRFMTSGARLAMAWQRGSPVRLQPPRCTKGSKAALLTERTDLTSAGIKRAVRTGVYVMPRFRKTEITDAELDAIVNYLMRAGGTGK